MPKRKSEFRIDLLADLADPREAARYFNAAAQDSEQMALVALRDIAEANQGMARVAKDAGVAREAVYRMLCESGNPAYRNLSAILKSVGLKLEVTPLHKAAWGSRTGIMSAREQDNPAPADIISSPAANTATAFGFTQPGNINPAFISTDIGHGSTNQISVAVDQAANYYSGGFWWKSSHSSQPGIQGGR